tara:strand:+ start:2382 stop:3638 length:1257 start_codon:yes stop_codon:yes gene_type:complete
MSNLLNSCKFNNFVYNSRRHVLTAVDKEKSMLIKVEVYRNPTKNFDIEGEYKIIKELNDKNCQTCPQAYELGKISKSKILSNTSEDLSDLVQSEFGYIIQEYIPHEDSYTLSDILLAMVEQKCLGYYQGDVKPANIRFNPDTKVCYLIDYDQALRLSEDQCNLSNDKFFNFCSTHDKSKYGLGDWLRHFKGKYTHEEVESLLVNGSLNIAEVTLVKTQNTTNTADGLYHTIDHKEIFLRGHRSLDTRGSLLSQVSFKENEKVLDVGCNQGLLSFYLHDRGCQVTGHDIDPHIITAAKLTANIMKKSVVFDHQDLDLVEKLDAFDTIMLFSVFHHTRKQEDNGKKIAASCNRIILETRLNENGSQPDGPGSSWVNVARWRFSSIGHLTNEVEKVFPGFVFNKNLGLGSKGRYILEFVKE